MVQPEHGPGAAHADPSAGGGENRTPARTRARRRSTIGHAQRQQRGSLKGEDLGTVTYSKGKTHFHPWDYPFTQSGYLLAGWSTDESGSGWIDCNVTFNSDMGFETLYAVWPAAGERKLCDFQHRGCWYDCRCSKHVNDLYCVELTENFKMPTPQRSDTATAAVIFYPIEALLRSLGGHASGSVILYAQWGTSEYHLEDNVSLVIGGEDKSDLLDSITECSGTGWTYQSVDGVSVLHLTKDHKRRQHHSQARQ